MRTYQIIILLFFNFYGIEINAQRINHFSFEPDTLILKTEKIKGVGLFSIGAGTIYFNDTTDEYYYPMVFPRNISNIKFAIQGVDWKPFQFRNLKKEKSDYLTTFLADNFPKKIDTLNIPSIKENSICIITGKRGNDTIFIVDENYNKDFRDDSIRLYQKLDWKSTTKLIKCGYRIYNGKEMVEDYSWVNIGTIRGNDLLFFVSHHLESTFSINDEIYTIGIVEGNSGFCFDVPIIALLMQDGIKKDTLLKSELLKKGEYLKLKNTYYRFDDVSNDGKYITLIKENNFNSKIGTQVGMIAPSFKCKTSIGELISSNSIKNKLLLIANISGCTSKSYDRFNQLLAKYGADIYILAVESGASEKIKGSLIDVEDEYNKDFYKKYRQAYSSYDCYLISSDGRIINKFDIFDWEKNLQGLKK